MRGASLCITAHCCQSMNLSNSPHSSVYCQTYILFGKPEGKRPLRRPGEVGRMIM